MVCFTDFMSDPKDNIINCPKCFGLVHRDCMKVWFTQAVNKGCCYCQDPGIKIFV